MGRFQAKEVFCFSLATLVCLAPFAQAEPARLKDYFPLHKGTVWTYEGVVHWKGGADKKPDEKRLRWTMEVLETFEESFFSAALLRGHPDELAFYEPGRKPSEYVIVNSGGLYYKLARAAWAVLKQPGSARSECLKDVPLFLDAPLAEGKRFCEPEQLLVQRNYCWNVTDKEVPLKGIRGIPTGLLKEHRGYELNFTTSPDHTLVGFMPGLGITEYTYVHHSGDGVSVEMKLIAYNPGQKG